MKYFFTELIICGGVLGFLLKNEYLSIYKEELEKYVFQNDTIVYQPIDEWPYRYNGDELPLSTETVEHLQQLDYIKEIRPMYLFYHYNVNYVYHNNRLVF